MQLALELQPAVYIPLVVATRPDDNGLHGRVFVSTSAFSAKTGHGPRHFTDPKISRLVNKVLLAPPRRPACPLFLCIPTGCSLAIVQFTGIGRRMQT